MSSYWQKLRDPRWQRKRLEIMQAADFTCQHCDSTEKTLNVHHQIYRKGSEPWEYESHELICLCEDCHEIWHALKDRLNQAIAKMYRSDLEQLIGYAEGMLMFQSHESVPSVTVTSIMMADGISDAISPTMMGAEQVLDSCVEMVIDQAALLAVYRQRRPQWK